MNNYCIMDLSELMEELTNTRKALSMLEEKTQNIRNSGLYHKCLQNAIAEMNADAKSNFYMNEYLHYCSNSGLNGCVEMLKSLRQTEKQLQERISQTIEENEKNNERMQIAASGLPEKEWRRKCAVQIYGTTEYYSEAGYILPDGQLLNFSGEKGRHSGNPRGQDHRNVAVLYAGNIDGTAAMRRFMDEGNIRFIPESPGIDISEKIQPTKEQYDTILEYVQYCQDTNKPFYLDVRNKISAAYTHYTPSAIVNAIKSVFAQGRKVR